MVGFLIAGHNCARILTLTQPVVHFLSREIVKMEIAVSKTGCGGQETGNQFREPKKK